MAFGGSVLCYQFVYTGSAKGSGSQSQSSISVNAPSHVISLARHKDGGPCRVGCDESKRHAVQASGCAGNLADRLG